MTYEINQPFEQFYDTNGRPLDAGYVYIGTSGLNPETNPITVYWDAAGTIPASQPLRTLNGFVVNYGTPAIVYATPASYSILVKNKDSATLFTKLVCAGDDPTLRADLAASSGSSLVGFVQSGTGAATRTLQQKARERVSVADMLTTDTPTAAQVAVALQAAIDTGAKKVFITYDYQINAGVTLRQNQIIDFDGGSLTASSDAVAANGILYGNAKAGIKIVDPIIDCSATSGIGGVNFVDCPGARIVDGDLTKANIALQATSNSVRMGYKVRGTTLNMDGLLVTAVYVSGVNKATLSELEIFGGKEGVGIYNDCRYITHNQIHSHDNTQDGFVVIAGHAVDYSGCHSYANGQSGFTTQRQTASGDTKNITYHGCQSYGNGYDGFDLRGANTTPYGVDMLITATACIANDNTGTGFYVVNAEGTTLTGCVAQLNKQQNFFIDNSARSILTGCRSATGAQDVATGANCAGILVYNSVGVALNGCDSSNSIGVTQEYGASFTGTSTGCSISGGYYENNYIAPINHDNKVYITGAAMQTVTNVWTQGVVNGSGAYIESGFGAPSHTRVKGSTFQRTDGGSGELYVSNGAGSWTMV